jgi:endonuclease/exonuclease/phosphatase family metal-dependent hydrolase
LLLALIVASRFVELSVRVGVVIAGFVVLFAIPEFTGGAAMIALAVPIVIVCALREAAGRRVRWSAATLLSLSALVFFALTFVFYNFYEFPPLWLVAYAPLAVFATLAVRAKERLAPRNVVWLASSCALTVLYVIPAPPQHERSNDVTVLSYNIHHGFDDDGMPGMQRTADEIAEMNPDLVALQEIGRGWTLLGGNDLIGYLRWRFPRYHVHYTPTGGRLWGNAVMSRLPVLGAGGGTFETEPGVFRYGWSAATVQFDSIVLPFYSVHLTANLEGKHGDPRVGQVEELQRMVRGQSPILIAGDFNSHPNDLPITSFAGIYSDLGAMVGLENLPTWPATEPNERIDYVFGRGVSTVAGAIPETTASDHLPVLLRVRIDDTTRAK